MKGKDDFKSFPLKYRQSKKKGRPEREKRAGARKIVKSLQWLSFPLVYWSGVFPRSISPEDHDYRPVQVLVADKIKGMPPGIYGIRSSYDPVKQEYPLNPSIECFEVTEKLIAKTSRSLQAARKYPKALPKIIPDTKSWLDRQGLTLKKAAAALRAVPLLEKDPTKALPLEETCLWLGKNSKRPSQRIQSEKVASWVSEVRDSEAPGKIPAALLLGRSSICRPGHIALALWESILGGKRPDGNFFEHFSSLIQAISRLESEPKKRYHALLQILTKTMEEIDEKVDENDFAGRKNDKDADRRLELFASIFIPHFCEFIRKQGLTIDLKIYPCSKALDFAYRYSLGGYFPNQLFKNLDWSTIFKELLKDIRYYEEKSEEKTAWHYSVLGLAFRIAAHSGREKSIPEISRWVDHCRVFSLRDRNENEISKMVVRSLETGFRCSKGEESNLDRLVMILSELGGHVLANELEYLMIYRSHLDFTFPRDMLENVMEKLKVISRYGPLSSDDCRFVITKNLVPSTKMVLMKETPPDSLLEFIQWLEVQEEKWFRLSLYHQQTWARLFRLPNRLLVKCLAPWATKKVAESGLSWEQMSALMSSLLRFCVNESDLEDDPYEPDDYPDDAERQRFIRDNIWIMNAVIDSVHKRFPGGHSDKPENDFSYAWHRRLPILGFAYYWPEPNDEDRKRLVSALLRYCQKQKDRDPFPGDRHLQKLAVLLSRCDTGHLLNLLSSPLRNLENPGKILQGWEFLSHHPEVQDFLSAFSKKTTHLHGFFDLLSSLATVRLLPEKRMLGQFFSEWQNPPTDDSEIFPLPLPVPVQNLWNQFVGYLHLVGQKGIEKESIRKIIRFPASLEKECQNLLKKKKAGKLDWSAEKRLEKISRYLKDPEEMNAQISGRLSRLLSRQIPQLKMQALEAGINKVIQEHWKTIVKGITVDTDDPEWDNALWLYLSIKKNRRILRRSLVQEARKNRLWIRKHPLNQKFLESLEEHNVDTNAWLQGLEKTWKIGDVNWQVYTENDPLKIFHMGNLYHTCLRVGGTHDYSVVANALEVNKRVLYMKNESGKIIGRRLLLLRKDGTLFGCRCYGSSDSYDFDDGGSPWVKICFDLFCMELIRIGRLRFPVKNDTVSKEEFELFSHWYFDGVEAFDQWITNRLFASTRKSESLLARLYKDIHRHLMDERYDREDLFRLLIWLGDDLMPVIDKVMRIPSIEKNDLLYISRFNQSNQVKKVIKEFTG